MHGQDLDWVLFATVASAVTFLLWFLANLVREGRRRQRRRLGSRPRNESGIWE